MSTMKRVARWEILNRLGIHNWSRNHPYNINYPLGIGGQGNLGYAEMTLFDANDPQRNAYYSANIYTQYYSMGASLTVDIANHNTVPVMVTIYELKCIHNWYTSILQLLSLSSPNGAGSSYAERDANPWDAPLFSRYFKVWRIRTKNLTAGRTMRRTFKPIYGRKGQVLARYHWLPGSTGSQDRYVKGVHYPILMRFQPMPAVTNALAGEIATIVYPTLSRMALNLTYNYKWKELDISEPTTDIVFDYPTPGEEASLVRAPGTLEFVNADD